MKSERLEFKTFGTLISPLEIGIPKKIICSHAKMFVGSKESTFTFRIQEEREIMGFSEEKTYRRFVKRVD